MNFILQKGKQIASFADENDAKKYLEDKKQMVTQNQFMGWIETYMEEHHLDAWFHIPKEERDRARDGIQAQAEADYLMITGNAKISLYEQLKKEARYALNTRSIERVYEVYGKAKLAQQLGLIEFDRYEQIRAVLVHEGINNPKVKLELKLQEKQSLFELEMYGEVRYFVNTSGLDADALCQAYLDCKKPYIDMAQYGREIDLGEYAEIEQSDQFAFAIGFHPASDRICIFDGNRRRTLTYDADSKMVVGAEEAKEVVDLEEAPEMSME